MNHHTALLLLSIFVFRLILSWSFVGTSLEIVAAIAPAEQVGTVPHIFLAPFTLTLDLLDSPLAIFLAIGDFSGPVRPGAVGLVTAGASGKHGKRERERERERERKFGKGRQTHIIMYNNIPP